MMSYHPLPTTVHGNIFRVDQALYSEDRTQKPRQFTLVIKDSSGQWIDVVIDRGEGSIASGHISNNGDSSIREALQLYLNKNNKITRWRPGVFGIPGNGGGDVFFDVPVTAVDVLIHVTVVG